MFRRPLQTWIDKHCRLRFQLGEAEARCRAIEAELSAVEASIRRVYPAFDPADFPPFDKKPKKHTFEPGTWTATAFRVLKDAGRPLTTLEIGEEVMHRHGFTEEQRSSLAPAVDASVGSTMLRAEQRGFVRSLPGRPKRWQLTDEAGA